MQYLNDNTYKMAWAKSIVEICSNASLDSEFLNITLSDIASKYIKYYWNQTIFFDLIQGTNPTKPPVILSLVKDLINKYFLAIGKKQPEVFEKVEDRFSRIGLEKDYQKTLIKIAKTLKQDVSWRFDSIQEDGSLYTYIKNISFF